MNQCASVYSIGIGSIYLTLALALRGNRVTWPFGLVVPWIGVGLWWFAEIRFSLESAPHKAITTGLVSIVLCAFWVWRVLHWGSAPFRSDGVPAMWVSERRGD
ncbi:MAG TPA: hypothetical protein VM492_04825 [Sumerlaeia bacterium]|nr:hypothetical protein [Sumerlaeia bacterium]